MKVTQCNVACITLSNEQKLKHMEIIHYQPILLRPIPFYHKHTKFHTASLPQFQKLPTWFQQL
jgi:hypothetical protein